MESTHNYESVGGVTAVVIYPMGTPLPELNKEEGTEEGTEEDLPSYISYELELAEEGSEYSEQWLIQGGTMAVKHTLATVTHQDYWPFNMREKEYIMRRGVVADVTLASGLVIRIGDTFIEGAQYALKLTSMVAESGDEPIGIPTKRWVWELVDRTQLL